MSVSSSRAVPWVFVVAVPRVCVPVLKVMVWLGTGRPVTRSVRVAVRKRKYTCGGKSFVRAGVTVSRVAWVVAM
ncbi:hypothetical protein ACH4SK_38805 [Streptomyces inhibens]|uniref:hypothetical protein n=1 Tax=Streptomyces inhibens TaxID=2293571 RepID=UPI0037BD4B95